MSSLQNFSVDRRATGEVVPRQLRHLRLEDAAHGFELGAHARVFEVVAGAQRSGAFEDGLLEWGAGLLAAPLGLALLAEGAVPRHGLGDGAMTLVATRDRAARHVGVDRRLQGVMNIITDVVSVLTARVAVVGERLDDSAVTRGVARHRLRRTPRIHRVPNVVATSVHNLTIVKRRRGVLNSARRMALLTPRAERSSTARAGAGCALAITSRLRPRETVLSASLANSA